MRTTRRLLALLASGAGALAVATGTANAADTAGPLAWTTCEEQPGFSCADLEVPLDYDRPHGEQIRIAVIRRNATDPSRRIGSLVWNPGGPGGSGTASAAFGYPYFPKEVRERFDIVTFDPRGIGDSEQLQCFDTPEQEDAVLGRIPSALFPADRTEERRTIDAWATFTKACAEHGGEIQNHMGTGNVARDLDRLRASLGDQKLSYWGPSYGSYLGETYANLFPENTGRLVLDGNVTPNEWNDRARGSVDGTFNRLNSAQGTEVALQLFLRECAEAGTARCSFAEGSYPRTAAKYYRLLGRLAREPVTVDGTTFTRALTITTVAGGLEYQNASPIAVGWKGVADQLQAEWNATQGSATPTAKIRSVVRTQVRRARRGPGLAGAFDASLTEGTYGVLCSESPNPRDPRSYRSQATRANLLQSPSGFGSLWTWQAVPCATWQARDEDRYTGPFTRSTTPLLAIGTIGDTNTAYSQTPKLATQMRNVRVLTESGGGHTALFNPSTCIQDHAARYLIDGRLPAPGTVCAQDQQPF